MDGDRSHQLCVKLVPICPSSPNVFSASLHLATSVIHLRVKWIICLFTLSKSRISWKNTVGSSSNFLCSTCNNPNISNIASQRNYFNIVNLPWSVMCPLSNVFSEECWPASISRKTPHWGQTADVTTWAWSQCFYKRFRSQMSNIISALRCEFNEMKVNLSPPSTLCNENTFPVQLPSIFVLPVFGTEIWKDGQFVRMVGRTFPSLNVIKEKKSCTATVWKYAKRISLCRQKGIHSGRQKPQTRVN